jgi:hypothetical protein
VDRRRQLFVSYFLGVSKGNGADAARRAGYKHARHAASRLLANVDIAADIAAGIDRVCMEQEEILARVSDLGRASLEDFVDVKEDGYQINIKKGKRLGRLQGLKKIKTKTRTYHRDGDDEPTIEVETEIEVHAPLAALKLIGEHKGLFKARSEIELKGAGKPVFQTFDDGRDPDLPPPTEAT